MNLRPDLPWPRIHEYLAEVGEAIELSPQDVAAYYDYYHDLNPCQGLSVRPHVVIDWHDYRHTEFASDYWAN